MNKSQHQFKVTVIKGPMFDIVQRQAFAYIKKQVRRMLAERGSDFLVTAQNATTIQEAVNNQNRTSRKESMAAKAQ